MNVTQLLATIRDMLANGENVAFVNEWLDSCGADKHVRVMYLRGKPHVRLTVECLTDLGDS